jgi:hypothetical protein
MRHWIAFLTIRLPHGPMARIYHIALMLITVTSTTQMYETIQRSSPTMEATFRMSIAHRKGEDSDTYPGKN